MTLKLYRPSNGTEGALFEARWCARCRKQARCAIPACAMMYDVEDRGYPREWRYGDDGQPQCTAFAEPQPHKPRRRRRSSFRQLPLFGQDIQ